MSEQEIGKIYLCLLGALIMGLAGCKAILYCPRAQTAVFGASA